VHYLEPSEARGKTGLRLVLTEGVPGPWGEAAKAIFHVKGIPFAPVRQVGGGENAELVAWTGHGNAPQAVLDGEPARCGWAEILFLAERLAPEPALLPADPAERALAFGLAHELCGEQGFGWTRRLMIFHAVFQAVPADAPGLEGPRRMARRYGYDRAAGEAAPARVARLLGMLAERLRAQRERGRAFLVGDALSAVDLYWAAFAAMVAPLPPALCPMSDFMRQTYTLATPVAGHEPDPILLEHRDRVYEEHLPLPLEF